MTALAAPAYDDQGPSAVLAPPAAARIIAGPAALPAPADTISADYGVQLTPGSMSFG